MHGRNESLTSGSDRGISGQNDRRESDPKQAESGQEHSATDPSPQRPPLSQLLHDLNQPLSAINTYAQAGTQLIDNGLGDPARLKELFAKIIAQSARATAMSQDMSKVLARDAQQS